MLYLSNSGTNYSVATIYGRTRIAGFVVSLDSDHLCNGYHFPFAQCQCQSAEWLITLTVPVGDNPYDFLKSMLAAIEMYGECSECADIAILNRSEQLPLISAGLCQCCFDNAYPVCEECGTRCAESRMDSGYCPDCQTIECDGCSDAVPRDDVYSHGGSNYCESCYDELFGTCECCEESIEVDELTSVMDYRRSRSYRDISVCHTCLRNEYSRCESCDNYFDDDYTHTSESGDTYCRECYSERFSCCEECGDETSVDGLDGDGRCSSCGHNDDDRNIDPDDEVIGTCFGIIKSEIRFGVEVETACCPDAYSVCSASGFGAKPDGTVTGPEFYSPILGGDNGLSKVIAFSDKALSVGTQVNNKCGFHLHLDQSELDDPQTKSVVLAYLSTESAWMSFVPESRRTNHYCAGWAQYGVANVKDRNTKYEISRAAGARYRWMNVESLTEHETVEIRLHSGTIDEDKLTNWIKAHTRFVKWASTQSLCDIFRHFDGRDVNSQFAALAFIWDDSALTDFYKARAAKFGTVLDSV